MANHRKDPGSPSGFWTELRKALRSEIERSDKGSSKEGEDALTSFARSIIQQTNPHANSFAAKSTASPTDTVASWIQLLSKCVDYLKPPVNKLNPFEGEIAIQRIYENHFVYAYCIDKGITHHTYLGFARKPTPEIHCSCILYRGYDKHLHCPHAFALAKYLCEELKNRSSKIYQQVRAETWDKHRPKMSNFEPSSAAIAFDVLGKLAADDRDGDLVSPPDSLKHIQQPVKQRLLWKIKGEGCHGIEAWKQTSNKKGNGWLKGTCLDSFAFSSLGNIELTEHDLQVSKFAKEQAGFFIFDRHCVEVLRRLIGAANIEIMGKPASIDYGDVFLRLSKQDGEVRFELDPSFGFEGKWCLAFHSDGITIDNAKQNVASSRIFVYPMDEFFARRTQELLSLAPVPAVHAESLIQLTMKAQARMPVVVDESLDANIIMLTARPVCVLRSNPDGRLDYGMRIRTSRGTLAQPGKGRVVESEIIDGVLTQYCRSPANEYRITQDTLRKLGLDSSADEGSLGDIDQALGLIQRLQELYEDVEVLWDKTTSEPIRYLGAVTAKNVSVGISRKRDWFNIEGKCKFDNETIDLSDLLNLTSGDENGDFVRIEGLGWAKMSADLQKQFRRLRDAVSLERKTIKCDLSAAHALRDLNGLMQVQATKDWESCLQRLERAEKLEPKVPANFKADLREYQVDGYRWMRRLAEWGVSGVLADDMGLGKTVQTLAVLLDRQTEGPALVIAPTSVGFNWHREAGKFTPDLNVHLYRETDREEFLGRLGPGDLVVCSYGLALRDIEKLKQVEWATLVLDEAQAIKNSRAKTSQAIATIPATWRLALTGTPVENHLGELWSLFHVISPGVFGHWEQFRKRFASPIEKEHDAERMAALRHRLQPFVLRRTKKEVLRDLPARTESNLHVELSSEEQALYEQVRREAIGEIDSITKLTDVKDQRFRILALLTRLRQLACHPRLVFPSWKERSSKLNHLLETVLQLREEGHRVLIFSQFVQHLQLIRELFDEEKISYQYLDGSTSPTERQSQVDAFQSGSATAFLISLKAGGTGLNLTAADYVIHMDPWWNPAVEDQATDRAHRIGQVKPVMVYRMISEHTIEEEILKLHESKRDLIAGVLEGAHAAAKLSTSDLIDLIRKD